MYLSKLRIFGFKSFANKVEVNFPGEGITSVVGPNGCGKSNIIDAIRWVLGEQKAKALRSSKMEEVIFSGTSDRPAMNLAEVSLLINNDSHVLPSDYTQIMITRRAFRDGDSEYLINNQPCRLKDIQNLFYDTGMGAASYSLMEAKMIDSILSDKADERRVMFEEAAGISKYKQQRRETLRQLERTAVDLARVEDNMRHLQQNVNMFERQARRAEKWRELKRRCMSLELSYQSELYREARGRLRAVRKEMAAAADRGRETQAQVATREAQLEERKLLLSEDEEALNALNQAAAATNAEVVRAENECERVKDRLAHLGDSLEKLVGDEEQAQARLAGIGDEKESSRQERLATEESIRSLRQRAAGSGEDRRRREENVALRRAAAEELAERRMEAFEALSDLRNRATALDKEAAHLRDDREEGEAALRNLLAKAEEFSREASALEAGRDRLEDAQGQLAGRLGDLRAGLEKRRAGLEAARAGLRNLENERVTLETRCSMLQSLKRSMEGMEGGVQFLLSRNPGRVRLLLDVLEVDDGDVALVEKALGRFLQVLLVGRREEALGLLDEVRAAEKGEAALLALEEEVSGFVRDRPDLGGRPGFAGWVVDRIRAPREVRAVLEVALGHVAAVDSLEAAHVLWPSLRDRDVWLITPSGEMLHGSGLLLGGARTGAISGLLQRKVELEQVESRLAEASREHDRRVEEENRLAAEIAGMEREGEALDGSLRQAERQVHEVQAKLGIAAASLAALEGDKEQAEAKLKQVRERLAVAESARSDVHEELAQREEERRTMESRFQAAMEEVRAAEQERAGQEQQFRELEKELGEAEARSTLLAGRLEYLERSEGELNALLARLTGQKEEWETQSRQLREKLAAQEGQVQALYEKLGEEEKRRDEVRAVYDSKASHLEEVRIQIRDLNALLREATQRGHELEMKAEQTRSYMASLRERMFELHEVDLDREEDAAEPLFEKVEYDPETVEHEIRDLKEKLKGLGNINAGALEDYEAEKQRLEDVSRQFEDLGKARGDLERAIRKLDKAAKERFLETFAIVQSNFQEVFSNLFEGGEAQLALEEGIDPLDAKIEINARPTGKKMRGVSLLSGGERALTAISLLFALYLVRPSPYCILDEVDGPLDDANIGRFVNLLRRFSHQTQFIVVTHNKRTMAASDMLYGVTQELKGISKLVSVQLDEASRLAA